MHRRIEAIILTVIVVVAVAVLPSLSILRVAPRMEPIKDSSGSPIGHVNMTKEESRNIGMGYSLLVLGAVQVYLIWRNRKNENGA